MKNFKSITVWLVFNCVTAYYLVSGLIHKYSPSKEDQMKEIVVEFAIIGALVIAIMVITAFAILAKWHAEDTIPSVNGT